MVIELYSLLTIINIFLLVSPDKTFEINSEDFDFFTICQPVQHFIFFIEDFVSTSNMVRINPDFLAPRFVVMQIVDNKDIETNMF